MKKEQYNIKNKNYFQNRLLSNSAAIENMILSATDKNVGTCWIGFFNKIEKELYKNLKISKDYKIISTVILGYKHENHKIFKRKKKIINKIS